jgi:hypothetical protein
MLPMHSSQPENRSRVKQNDWDLDTIMPMGYRIPPPCLDRVAPDVRVNFCKLLSRDVYSEGDAQFLYDHIVTRSMAISPDFLVMLDLWLADELKHYEALRRTYHCVAGVDFADMNRAFASRSPEIEPIEMLLTDEFTILVAMMFDEVGSLYSYRRDLREYYHHFGTAVRTIGRHLVTDEGMHFNNAAELLLNQHDRRLGEVGELLAEIAALEQSLETYHQSFFLDHAQEKYRFPPEFNPVLIRLILSRLGLGPQPHQWELQALWQGVPHGG